MKCGSKCIPSSNYSDTGANLWVGLSRPTHTEAHAWSDGTTVEYTKWADGQPPETEAENCVHMKYDSGAWVSVDCGDILNWMCKLAKGIGSQYLLVRSLIKGSPGRNRKNCHWSTVYSISPAYWLCMVKKCANVVNNESD